MLTQVTMRIEDATTKNILVIDEITKVRKFVKYNLPPIGYPN